MKVSFHRNFKKSYKKAPKRIREQFKDRLRVFLEYPFHPLLNNHALQGKYSGLRSINVTGDFRAWYEVLSDSEVQFVIIGTHSELYS